MYLVPWLIHHASFHIFARMRPSPDPLTRTKGDGLCHLLLSATQSAHVSVKCRVCVCVSYKCGKTGELLEETWAAKKSEGQDMRAEGGIKRRVGCRMVARVTVRVATPYVNPPIWSILQSKRIGFLWRWISSAGKLFLPLSLSHLLYLLYLSLWLFFLVLLWFHVWFLSWLASSPLPAFSASPWWCLFGHIRIDMIPCDIFQMPICLSHLRDYSMCCVFSLMCVLCFCPPVSVRGDREAVIERA